jgi:hypothetical protein
VKFKRGIHLEFTLIAKNCMGSTEEYISGDSPFYVSPQHCLKLPEISHILPAEGLDIGGLTVSVFGENFAANSTYNWKCKFGTNEVQTVKTAQESI